MTPSSTPLTVTRLQHAILGLLAAILTLLLIGMIGGAIYLLGKADVLTPTYSVSVSVANAGGVGIGTSVWMAGVPVGLIERTTVQGGQAVLRLRIRQENQLPAGSRFEITPALFSMPAVLKIIPPMEEASAPNNDPRLASGGTLVDPMASLTHMDAVMDQWTQVGRKTSRMLDETTQTTERLNALMRDDSTRRQVRQTLTDVQTASRNGAQMTAQMTALIRRTGPQSTALLADLAQTSKQINAMTRAGQPQVAKILANTVKTTDNTTKLSAQGMKLLSPSPATVRQLTGALTDLSATAANLKDLTGKMNTIADQTQTVSGDPQVQADLKVTLHNLRALTEATQQLVSLLTKAAAK